MSLKCIPHTAPSGVPCIRPPMPPGPEIPRLPVMTVNGMKPDANGNVSIDPPDLTDLENRVDGLDDAVSEESRRAVAAEDALSGRITDLGTAKADKATTYTKEEVDAAVAAAKPGDYEQVKAQVSQNAEDIDAVEGKIPSQASAQNQLADKEFVNSSVATSTATFRGTSDAATQAEFETWLDGLMADENDYVFWRTADAVGNSVFKRYKYNGVEWGWEFDLNNSSFTAEQWAAISSGITSGAVAKLDALPTAAALSGQMDAKADASALAAEVERARAAEQGKADKATTYTKDEVDAAVAAATPSDYDSVKARLAAAEGKIPEQASAQNQLADKAFVNSSIATNTAFYISDGGRPFQSLADLETYEGTLTNNDYAFVVGQDSVGNTTYTRYKWSEATETWAEEYVLNNSSFTAAQWAAINSGITSGLVEKLNGIEAGAQVNTVTSVNSKTGAVSLAASDVGVIMVDLSDGSANIYVGNDYVNIKNITLSTNQYGNKVIWLGAEEHAVIPVVDSTPQQLSLHAVASGGVHDALALKAPLASPAFTGMPTAPTPAAGDNSTKVATTAFVQAAISNAVAAAVAAINYDYFMRVNPSTGAVYYTTPGESANNSNEQEAE